MIELAGCQLNGNSYILGFTKRSNCHPYVFCSCICRLAWLEINSGGAETNKEHRKKRRDQLYSDQGSMTSQLSRSIKEM